MGSAADHRNTLVSSRAPHVLAEGFDVVGHDARASKAQGDPGAAVPVIVDQKLWAESARDGLILKPKTDPALTMWSDADDVGLCGMQEREVGVR